ncbi:MAG: tripartite tricarboxylate transporter substrate binding protein [Burkholderiales bacterium]|nr:tripartite tricarboxylate transporter substrate binding protein [Burkholderiales bacterium]
MQIKYTGVEMLIRESVLRSILVSSVALSVCPAGVAAQETGFPTRPVTIVVPFPPGGFLDLGARVVAESLSRELKVPVVVENKAGGAGLVGATAFLNTRPDGHTLLSASGAAVISTVQLSKAPAFDPRKDLLPVAYLGDTPSVMAVGKSSPFTTFSDFVQYARSNPGKLKGTLSGLGGEAHIIFEGIRGNARIDSKLVPAANISGVITAVLGGHVDWMTGTLPGVLQYHKSGDMKILLLTRRASELPGVPSGADAGFPDISVNVWMAMFAHSKTPRPVHDRLVSAVSRAVKDPEVAKRLARSGVTLGYRAPVELAKLIDEQWTIYAKVIKEAGLKVD